MIGRLGKLVLAAIVVVLIGGIGIYYLFPGTAVKLLVKTERAVAGLEQRRIQAAALDFVYLEGGRGEPLVLLHGFGANKDHWTRIGRYLTPRFRVIAPDLTGFGESSPAPDGDYTIRAQVQRVNALVHALGLASFHLGGSSMGGHIAGAYAATYPNQVKTLLLISPGGVASAKPSEMQRLMTAGGANPLVVRNADDYERLLEFVFAKAPFVPRPIKSVLMKEAIDHQSLNTQIFAQIHRSWTTDPLEALLAGCPVATLVIWGEQDRVLHVSGAKILEAVMPAARAVGMASVGHLPMIEKPHATADIYLNWPR